MKMSSISGLVVIACGGCVCLPVLSAQSVAFSGSADVPAHSYSSFGPVAVSSTVTSGDATGAAPATSPGLVVVAALPKDSATATKPLTARWLDLTTFSHTQRYRNQYGDDGFHYFENGQERSLLAGRIKLDEEGKYAIGFRASTGRSFN